MSSSSPPFQRLTTLRVISALSLREMNTAHSRSPGGALWLLAEPIAAIALLSLLFSFVLRAPSLGSSFPLFYATGYLPFALYGRLSLRIGMILFASRGVLSFPVITIFDTILARLLVAMLTGVVTMCVVIGGIHIAFGLSFYLEPLAALNAIGMAMVLGTGVGTLNAYLFRAFPVWVQIWGIVTRPLFLISGVLFIYQDIPASMFREWLLWNPLIHVTAQMRVAFYPTYAPDYISGVFVYGIGLSLMVLGLVLLNRNHDDLVYT